MKYIIAIILTLSLSLSYGQKDLYIMYSPTLDAYKVGQTNNADRRLEEIDRAIDCKANGDVNYVIVYEDLGHLESTVHDCISRMRTSVTYCKKNLRSNRISSREWFALDSIQLGYIDRLITVLNELL